MSDELDSGKLKDILSELNKERPVFDSEDDFKFSLAWKIKEKYGNEIDIRLEKKINREENDEKNQRIDIFIYPWKIGIELKYFTAECDYESDDERIKLKNQFAYDHKCYDAWKDIQRLETFIKKEFIKKGFAIWLTNVSSLTTPCEDIKKDKSGYSKFRICNGREVKSDDVMDWNGDLSKGTTKGRRKPIELKENYKVHWNVYSDVSKDCNKNGIFKYALIEVRDKGV